MNDRITIEQCRDLRKLILEFTSSRVLTQEEYAEILNVLIGAMQRVIKEEAQNEKSRNLRDC